MATRVELAVSMLLIVVLSFFGLRLSDEAISLARQKNASKNLGTLRSTSFQMEAGIDIFGNQIYPLPPSAAERTVIFMLRANSLATDLKFWNDVSTAFPPHSHIRLVAYCDSASCSEYCKRSSASIHFPIIFYGEVFPTEELFDVDSHGEFLIRSEQWFVPKLFAWRDGHTTPNAVAHEVLL